MIVPKNSIISRSYILSADILEPFLDDENPKCPEAEFTSYVNQAIDEIEAKLIPIPTERLDQIITRLFLYFTYGDKAQLNVEYSMELRHYPEDLLCAAYHYILTHYSSKTLPALSEFHDFMEPEMQRRRDLHRKLLLLNLNKEA